QMLAALQAAIADLEPALLEVARDRLLRSCDSASLLVGGQAGGGARLQASPRQQADERNAL
ncbi:hypothetical protein HaLaN_32446, partial [Haematococcus lacustris]